jgi:hypothetical protein
MKKYFVSFTYYRNNSDGDRATSDLLTFEVLELETGTAPSKYFSASRGGVLLALKEMGYTNVVNVVSMNPL